MTSVEVAPNWSRSITIVVSQWFDSHSVGDRLESHAGGRRQVSLVRLTDPASTGDPIGERAQLAAADGGVEVAHPVVEADLAVLVPGHRLAGLRGQVTGMGDDRRVVAT